MFWLGKTIKKSMDHASQNTCKMNNINMLQAGNCSVAMLVVAIKTGDASNTSLPVKCTSSITFSNLKKIQENIQACVSDKQSFSQEFWAKNAPIKLSETGEECVCFI